MGLKLNPITGQLDMVGTGGGGGTGDVVGPAGATANNIVLFDGLTGKVIKDGGQGLPAGTLVGTTDTQTLTNKTLSSPAITTPTGIVKGDVGLGNVDNTSDANKPVSTAQQTALNGKFTQRTITGTTNQITVTNGDGVSGNPTLSLPSAITTPGTLTTTGVLSPSADSTYTLGTSSLYWSNTYTDRLYFNSTAYFDGGTAGAVGITGNVGIGTATPSEKLAVTGNIAVSGTGTFNNLTLANPGVGNESRLTFTKTNDGAWLSVKEYASDSTDYGFFMSDNPDSPGDRFFWQINDWQGAGGAWRPLQFSGLDAHIRATDINTYGTYNIYGAWYSGVDGNPGTVFKSGAGTLNITPNVSGFTGDTRIYWLKIDGSGAPNTFKWGIGSYPLETNIQATGVAITGGAQTLDNNVTVTFSGTTGGQIGDVYQFRVNKGGDLNVQKTVTAAAFSGGASDTAAAPSYTWTGDTDTGMFRPGNDLLGLSTAGSERMRILANGNVGIGTTTPDYKLQVNGTIAPEADSASDLGAPSLYFANTYTDRLYVNSTAYLDGGTAGIITTTGDLRVTTAGTNSASVVTVGGTQTLTNKTLTGGLVTADPSVALGIASKQYVDAYSTTTQTRNETPSGTINGSNVTFTTAATPTTSSLRLYLNGIRLKPAGADYTLSGSTITMVTAPATSSVLLADYEVSAGTFAHGVNNFITNEVPTGTVNSSNVNFTTAQSFIAGTLQVYINGLKQLRTTHYTETTPASGTFAMSDAPLTGDVIEVSYQHTLSSTGAADTVDGYHADDLSPIGSLLIYAGTAVPSANWLFCYGQAISRTTYATLFSRLSTTYGVGDGSTTFNVPDLRGRTIAGQDDMGGTSANRLTNPASTINGIDGDTLGGTGGAETHVITTAQLAAHTHTTNTNFTAVPTASPTANVWNGNQPSTAFSVTTTSTGSDAAHNNVQPTIILNYIIKVA